MPYTICVQAQGRAIRTYLNTLPSSVPGRQYLLFPLTNKLPVLPHRRWCLCKTLCQHNSKTPPLPQQLSVADLLSRSLSLPDYLTADGLHWGAFVLFKALIMEAQLIVSRETCSNVKNNHSFWILVPSAPLTRAQKAVSALHYSTSREIEMPITAQLLWYYWGSPLMFNVGLF